MGASEVTESAPPVTAGTLRSQIEAAIERWESDGGTAELADVLMETLEPSLAAIAGSREQRDPDAVTVRAADLRMVLAAEGRGTLADDEFAAFERLASAYGSRP